MKIKPFIIVLLFLFCNLFSQRKMEFLNRGLIAVRKSPDEVFLSWRFLGTDPDNISFNIYKNGIRINSVSINESTNYIDNTPANDYYYISKIIDGKEIIASGNVAVFDDNYIEIPLSEGSYYVQHAWPGDLDGDGQYEIVLSRLPLTSGDPVVEAYTLDGTHLWTINMGPNASIKQSGVGENDDTPAGISGWSNTAGYRDTDNITVYDLDNDGKAEVYIRTAEGVIFGDGKILSIPDKTAQFVSVINGMTGAEMTRTYLPSDYKVHGPLSGHMGIAYLNGIDPSLIMKLENRRSDKVFNLMIVAYDYDGKSIKKKWLWKRENTADAHNFHQIRIIDVNNDGKDDICDGSYVIKNDGTFLYGVKEAVHGDRFHITDIDPDRPGLEGYGIQQAENGNYNQFPWYYYDAATGDILKKGNNPQDVGRGTVGDIDPRYKGCEMWSIDSLFSCKGNPISTNYPTVNFKIWWDGDLSAEILDKTYVYKWDYLSGTQNTMFSGNNVRYTWRNAPPFYGDIIGDWREEILWEASVGNAIRIYTTTDLTSYRIYTLPHNAGYRNDMTTKGYYQSNLVDYYLGTEMEFPSNPDIVVQKKNIESLLYPPWKYRDVGVVKKKGWSVQNGNYLSLNSSGLGVSSKNDKFGFVYQTVFGDVDIIARIDSINGDTENAIAGLMIRESLEDDSRSFMIGVTKTQGLMYQRRKEKGDIPSIFKKVYYPVPIWLKLSKKNNIVNVFSSDDGVNWKHFKSDSSVKENIFCIGLAASGLNKDSSVNVFFSNVKITGNSTGFLLREIWNGITGSSVEDLISSDKFDSVPDITDYIYSFESPSSSFAENFGFRISGFIVPPRSGYYTFYVAGDESCQLWLSDDTIKDKAIKIAVVNSKVNERQYDSFPEQRSDSVYLEENKKYYIELLHKEENGNDHFSVFWESEFIDLQPIIGKYCVPYYSDHITGIDILKENWQGIKLFPNPSNNKISVILPDNCNNMFYYIYNTYGQLIKKGLYSKDFITIDIHSFNKGVYILVIGSDIRYKAKIYKY